ncbi:unnamed protein product [Angiostrongylus costaricensis]|uniref:Uncharacterized protein n=1 Tax=Angiostrongylus costaricensis TaxID=334426 RepID=A0A0R3PH72_ANGCS|nr:unnamed protein product [Angiostrongylus costaricensis]
MSALIALFTTLSVFLQVFIYFFQYVEKNHFRWQHIVSLPSFFYGCHFYRKILNPVLACRLLINSLTTCDFDNVGAGLPRRPLATRLLGAVVIAVCLFTLSLPMQRLAELHVFVIVINFIHIVLVCLSTTFFTFFYSERRRKNVKDE